MTLYCMYLILVAEMIKDSLEGVVSNTLPHFCNCVPDVVSGEGCFVYGTEFTLKFPECGGTLLIILQ